MHLHFHNGTCAYNQCCNIQQKTVLLLQSIFTSLFHSYLFTKSSLQSPLTLPSSIAQQFFTSLFLCATIPTIYTKNVFSLSTTSSIQAAPRDQWARKSFEDWNCFNLSLLSQSLNSENRLTITDYLLLRLWKLVYCRCGKPSNPPFLNLLSLLSYPNNTTARTHIPLETSCLNWFSS